MGSCVQKKNATCSTPGQVVPVSCMEILQTLPRTRLCLELTIKGLFSWNWKTPNSQVYCARDWGDTKLGNVETLRAIGVDQPQESLGAFGRTLREESLGADKTL